MTEQQYLLTQLMEECAEVIHRCSKAIRFGGDEIQQGHTMTNRERIGYELNDLVAVVDELESRGMIPPLDEDAMLLKKAKIAQYLKYSRELGIL